MPEDTKSEPLHIVLISVHGLIRGCNLELGRDADTGGQTKYVVELAKALAKQPHVARVDLITRRVVDSQVSSDYAVPAEAIAENAHIVRIEGGPEEYIRKEKLWDYLDGFADNVLAWMHRQSRWPDILHSHYADAGYVGVLLSHWTGLPLIHTGHSLGRDKRRRLLATGLQMEEIESRYRMSRRINAEEDTLASADLVVTSTRNEIEDQYELYNCYTPEKMLVIPPGTDLEQFYPPDGGIKDIPFTERLGKFLQNPDKPIILALSRPDARKNIITLLEAYGESPQLQQLANLVIVAGNRDDIRALDEGPQAVLTELLLVIDSYDLYGRVALPKQHAADEVAAIYRLAAATQGVFVNPALTEPFGLTLLEAAASGLPLVATENGGPVDIIGNCRNGLLVDPLDKNAIAGALAEILENPARWREFSTNGMQNVARHYSWDAHAQAYLEAILPLSQQCKPLPKTPPIATTGRGPMRAIFTAIDETLLGDDQAILKFVQCIRQHRKRFLFGVATWRRLDSALAILKKHKIPMPDILITSLGTEIYYAPQLIADIAWTNHIDHMWTPQELRRVIGGFPGLTPLIKTEHSRFKLSYRYDAGTAPPVEDILTVLRQQEISANPVLSFGKYFEIVPARASKGRALRYFAQQWRIPMERILVAGGSSADTDMLRGNTLGVVVANKNCAELAALGETERIYLAQNPYAWGILEAIEHYDFFNI